jgi:hypothetical protein
MKILSYLFIGLVLLAGLSCVPVAAAQSELFPQAFYGTVTINGNPAPVETIIEARGDNVDTGSGNPITTTEEGKYGGPGPLDEKLIVWGENITDETVISFYINNVAANETAVWQSDVIQELDLTVNISSPILPTVSLTAVAVNLFGNKFTSYISTTGEISGAVTASSPDKDLTIAVASGTIALDKDGKPITLLTGTKNSQPPSPPAGSNIIGLAYDFEPSGATFSPPVTMTFHYSLSQIPQGVNEQDLVLVFYNAATGKWVEIHGEIDTMTHQLKASVFHFCTFAVIGKITAASTTPTSTATSTTLSTTTSAPASTTATTSTSATSTTSASTSTAATTTPVTTSKTTTPTSTPPVAKGTNWTLIGILIAVAGIIAGVVLYRVTTRKPQPKPPQKK